MRHSASKIREILICNDDDLHSYPLMYLQVDARRPRDACLTMMFKGVGHVKVPFP